MVVVPGLCALVKSQQDGNSSDSYINELQKINLEPVVIPALAFTFINSDRLLLCLQQFDKYGSLIFTSSRVVEAVVNALNLVDKAEREKILSEWRRKRNFVVGETTSNMAESKLQIVCSGQISGSAKALVSIILEQTDLPTLPFLYPCSNLANDDILTLNEHGKFGKFLLKRN
ncbi:uroporphyrinogen-III synthase-like [Centruroides sculpturatus]|uniref:uroporphyrinogen-III synthase-like n=1 Tax=Centruroides sculpturatus TaxID=218467 RepID=UPI000C6DDE78|nr:uroporphyrinogen-III synthase-like [Centruroides sculpturatus]